MKNKKKILITGANGFAGRHLKEYLGNKYTLFTPSHKEMDLLNEKEVDNFFKTHEVDVVIHTALVGGSRKEEHVESALSQNLRMFFNIVRNKKRFKKMIHCGSGAEYDKRFPIVQVREEDFDKRVPADEYGYGKYLCSKYIEESENIVCLRIFALFGKYEDYRYRFISNAICRNIYGMPITMRQNVYFDYIYINDFVRIVEYFIENKAKHKFYNAGTGKRVDLKTIAEKINEIANKKSEILIKNSGLNNEYTCDNSRLAGEMKGFKFTEFDNYMTQLYTWYKENKKIIKKELI
ncbi:NAD(P)-dependent oxidoreductase [Patescibacteria group bacterium]|nr:NAD(P)-dependent oxidoreductase [Patescibacteria group bacterium]